MAKKFWLIVLWGVLMYSSSIYGFKQPVIPSFQDLKEHYASISAVDSLLTQSPSPNTQFKAGLYYFFMATNADASMSLRKGVQKKYNEKAISLFEEASKSSPANSYYLVMLGNAYGYEITFVGFPALLQWSGQCRSTIKKAVDLDPKNPEILMGRFRSNVHFPYQYYPSIKQEILDDYAKIQLWIEESKKNELTAKDKRYFSNLEGELNYWTGYYFFNEVKDVKEAKKYLSKVKPGCPEYKLAQSLLKKG